MRHTRVPPGRRSIGPFEGWELSHIAAKAKAHGLLTESDGVFLNRVGRQAIGHQPVAGVDAARLANVLKVLSAAHLGGAPCDRVDCSACAKLAAGTSTVAAVAVAPEPAKPVALEPTFAVSYTPQRIPELTFSEADGQVLAKVHDGVHEEARLWRLNLEANRLAIAPGFDELLCLLDRQCHNTVGHLPDLRADFLGRCFCHRYELLKLLELLAGRIGGVTLTPFHPDQVGTSPSDVY